MKDDLRQLLKDTSGPSARNLVREYLQAQVLASLQRAGAMAPLAFHGGTALRFLYSIRRHSEDLDFALEQPRRGYDFRGYLRAVLGDLRRLGYTADLARVSDARSVHSAFVRLPGLLRELGLSAQAAEALAIRIEVDTRPPRGAGLETTIVRRHELLHLQHHDRASLLAGKLHAVLQRPYPKGRDFYDLIWYLGDRGWPPPNLEMLNDALRQTGWSGKPLTQENWRGAVRRRVRSLSWEALAADVRPFLESAEDRAVVTKETLLRLLG
ncbi:MAG TPA: nucleotidyl transferase AbiEii/AbiGii toxin family protein [Vicinamibacteria bacterium]|nr:nucleotidyl transferase AbiEii/AbiGii toxin family protein [Vicinamibacteria bacterium]